MLPERGRWIGTMDHFIENLPWREGQIAERAVSVVQLKQNYPEGINIALLCAHGLILCQERVLQT